jgi:hypothetical protein
MSSLALAGLVFGCAFGTAVVAMLVARRLPGHHLSSESKDVVKLGLGMIATLTALVLGLLVASAKGTYDAQDAAVKQMATNVRLFDRAMSVYGEEADETKKDETKKDETNKVRELLRQMLTLIIEQLWPQGGAHAADLTPGAAREVGDALYGKLTKLQAKTDAQRALKSRAMDLAADMAQTRYRMQAQKESSVPPAFLVVLGLWLVTLFAGYGVLAPPNATVVTVLLVCALSIAAALFLMLELGRPFAGVIQVSSAPLQDALSQIGK